MDRLGSQLDPLGTLVTHDRVIANDTRSYLPIRNAALRRRYRFLTLSVRLVRVLELGSRSLAES